MIIGKYTVIDRHILGCCKFDMMRIAGIFQYHIFKCHILGMCKPNQCRCVVWMLCTLPVDRTAMKCYIFKSAISGNTGDICASSETKHRSTGSTNQRNTFHINIRVAVHIERAACLISSCRYFDAVDSIAAFAVTCRIQRFLECFFKIYAHIPFYILHAGCLYLDNRK